jgi:hypothetical protein
MTPAIVWWVFGFLTGLAVAGMGVYALFLWEDEKRNSEDLNR